MTDETRRRLRDAGYNMAYSYYDGLGSDDMNPAEVVAILRLAVWGTNSPAWEVVEGMREMLRVEGIEIPENVRHVV